MILIRCITANILRQPSILPCLWMHVDAWEVRFRTLTYLVAVQCESSHNTRSSQDKNPFWDLHSHVQVDKEL